MKQTIDRGWARAFVMATTLIMSGTAGAGDGVIEVNQVCATSTGCSSGDGAGFPVDLGGFGTARSYILTSDLVPTNSGSTMFINGDNVTLDMNGFRILCGPSSTFGIRFFPPQKNLRVSNGKIVGCQSGGIGHGFAKGGDGARIDRVTVDSSAAGGIDVGDNSIVENSTAINSGNRQGFPDVGIRLGSNCIARNNVASGANNGMIGSIGCLFSGNIIRNNTSGLAGQSSTFINNTSVKNSQSGIIATNGSNVIGNTLRDNGTGLNLSNDTTYRGNSITGSTQLPIRQGAGQNRGGNTCLSAGSANIFCP